MSQKLAEPDALPRPLPGAVALGGAGPLEEHGTVEGPGAGPREHQQADDISDRKAQAQPAITRSETVRVLRELRVEREKSEPATPAPSVSDDMARAEPIMRAPSDLAPAFPSASMHEHAPSASVLPRAHARNDAAEAAEPTRAVAHAIEARSPIQAHARRAEPVPQRAAAAREHEPEVGRLVKVSIGRIEIRTGSPQAAVVPARNPTTPTRVSLDDYLARARR